MNDQAVMRAVFPRHTAKHIARLLNVPLETARHWLHRSLNSYRRAEVALLLLQEFDRETERRAELRRRLCVMAGLTHEVEIYDPPSVASAAADIVGTAADRIEAAINWLEKE